MTHIPVMLKEILQIFEGKELKNFLDGTLGLAGHAKALLEAHPEIECYFGVDQDLKAMAIAKENLAAFEGKVKFIHKNYADFPSLCDVPLNGILLDIGVSSLQLDDPKRGFSFLKEGPLDMRMNRNQRLTAKEIVNYWTEKKLQKIFRDYGEERRWKLAAKTIVEARKRKKIKTTQGLIDVLLPIFPKNFMKRRENYKGRKKMIHPATRIFQALRIAVNSELDVLEQGLPKLIDCLDTGGVMTVISFHSLEDRIVKNVFREAKKEKVVELITKKPLTPTQEEVKVNARSRSAKLRACIKL